MIELTEINPYLLEAVIIKGNDVAFFSNGSIKRLTIPSETPLDTSVVELTRCDLKWVRVG